MNWIYLEGLVTGLGFGYSISTLFYINLVERYMKEDNRLERMLKEAKEIQARDMKLWAELEDRRRNAQADNLS